MISTKDAPLEVGPKALNGIGGHITHGILLHPVTDNIVDITFLRKTVVGREFIGENPTVISNELLDNRHKGNGLGVLYLHGTDITLTGHHTEDRGLGLGATALSVLGFLAFVLVGFTATKIHLIALHFAIKGGSVILLVEGTNLMENVPSGLLRDIDVRSQLNGGDTLLVARDKVHRNEPLAEGNLRVLKDSSHKHGEIGLAVTAMETAIGSNGAMVLTAERADNIFLLPTGFVDGLTAFLLGGEVIGQFKDAIEASEVNHKTQVSRCFYIIIP